MSPTRFAWEIGLGRGGYPPPEPRRGPRFAASPACWLCGGDTEGVGWPRHAAIPVTFASHNLAAAPHSDAVCQPCAALAVGETWQERAAELALKTWPTASWRSWSHLFAPGHHECPGPTRWRAILLDPPEPPFLAVMALSAQKNLIFRGRIARSADRFPVQVEEETVMVARDDFGRCLAAFETLRDLGFGRDQIATGRYHQAAIAKAGLGPWRAAEAAFAPWRTARPDYVLLARNVARKADQEAP